MTREETLKGLIIERNLAKENRDIWDEEEDRIKNDRYVEMLSMAIKAVDRDTPKKVNIEQWIDTKCPNGCGHILSTHHGDGYHSIDKKPTFCPLCGQRLDWEEEDDEE